MKWIPVVVRTLLALVFVIFGLNFFLNVLPMPTPELPESASYFMKALVPTGYIQVVKLLEVIGGGMLMTGIFAPLGLVILTPIIVNIVMYDIFLMGSPAGLGLPMLVMAVYLIWVYWPHFQRVFWPAPFLPHGSMAR